MRSFKSLFALVGLLFCLSQANAQSYQQVVQTSGSGDKVFLEINLRNLQESMDSIFSNLSGLSSSSSSVSWGDVLQNGSNPGMDINFNSYDIQGLGNLTATGTLNADSLTLNKDADITGSLSVTDVVDFGDSLSVTGYVLFSDSLQVVKAVTIGETLFVTGVTSLGDSLHVSGNVDLDALFNVDGAATFGSTVVVTGETTLNDSLHVNSGANITGTLEVDGKTTLNDSLHAAAAVDIEGNLRVNNVSQLTGDTLMLSSDDFTMTLGDDIFELLHDDDEDYFLIDDDGSDDYFIWLDDGDIGSSDNMMVLQADDGLRIAVDDDRDDAGIEMHNENDIMVIYADSVYSPIEDAYFMQIDHDETGGIHPTFGGQEHIYMTDDLGGNYGMMKHFITDDEREGTGNFLGIWGSADVSLSANDDAGLELSNYFNAAVLYGDSVVVKGDAFLQNDLQIDGDANITGTLEVDGKTTLNDSLHVNASVDVAGDLSVGGEFQAASLRADSSIAQGGSASNYNTVALGASSVASGIGAVAAGYGTSAAGVQSTAIGTNASASGINAVAIGEGAQASAVQAVAVGKNAKVSSDYASTAVGMNSEVTVGWGHTALGGGKVNPSTANSSQNMAFGASTISTEGSYNISMGYNSTISGNSSTTGSMTFGPSSTVSGGYRNMTFGAGASISGPSSNSNYAMGDYSSVSGGAWHAYALGNNSKVQANGHHAFAFGHYSEVSAYNAANFAFKTPARFSHQAIFGAYADTTQMVPVSGSHNDWIGSDPLFVVANGATESTRSNALIIRKDGAALFNDSMHVAGHVTMADQLTVTGETTLNDSLHVNSGANITGTLEVDGETTLNDSLHVNSGVNITGDLVLGTTNVNNALADIIPFNHYEAWIQHSSIISGITASTTSAQMFVDSTSTQSVDPESIYGLSGGDVTIQSSGYYEIQGYVFGSRTTAGSGYVTAFVSVGPGNPLPQCTATEEWTLNVSSSVRTNCRIQVFEGQTIRLRVVEQAGGTSNITDAGIVLKKVANTLSPG